MKQVAILMPVFNGGKTIARALESIGKQTYPLDHIKLFVVDNNSSDDTVDEISKYFEDMNHRALMLTCEEQGIVPALNKGLFRILGEDWDYIARLDADDYWHPTKLEKQIAFLEEHPEVSILGTQIQRVTPEFGPIPSNLRYPVTDVEIKKALLSNTNAIAHPSVVVRPKVFLRTGGYDNTYPIAEDYHLWLKASKWFNFANLEETLVDYTVTHNPNYNPLTPQLACMSMRTAYERLHK